MKAKPKPGKTAKPKRQAAARPAARGATLDLLKIVDRMDRRLMVAEGVGGFRQKQAMALAERLEREGTYNFNAWSPSDKIIFYQFIRDGIIGKAEPPPREIAFAIIDDAVEDIAKDDVRLEKLYQESENKHREAGFGPDDEWPEDKRPKEIQALFNFYWKRLQLLKIAILRKYDEHDMADLLESDPDAYDAKVEKGNAAAAELNERRKLAKEAGK